VPPACVSGHALRYTRSRRTGRPAEREGAADVAKKGIGLKQAAAELGATPARLRAEIAAGTISPARMGSKRNGRFLLTPADVDALRAKLGDASTAPVAPSGVPAAESAEQETMLARMTQLEAERSNLLARVAWERALALSHEKSLEAERARTEKLEAELGQQRARVEALKALSAWDRVLGRHKSI
jgi:hypothetical protein